jgi:hypothetical protein
MNTGTIKSEHGDECFILISNDTNTIGCAFLNGNSWIYTENEIEFNKPEVGDFVYTDNLIINKNSQSMRSMMLYEIVKIIDSRRVTIKTLTGKNIVIIDNDEMVKCAYLNGGDTWHLVKQNTIETALNEKLKVGDLVFAELSNDSYAKTNVLYEVTSCEPDKTGVCLYDELTDYSPFILTSWYNGKPRCAYNPIGGWKTFPKDKKIMTVDHLEPEVKLSVKWSVDQAQDEQYIDSMSVAQPYVYEVNTSDSSYYIKVNSALDFVEQIENFSEVQCVVPLYE